MLKFSVLQIFSLVYLFSHRFFPLLTHALPLFVLLGTRSTRPTNLSPLTKSLDWGPRGPGLNRLRKYDLFLCFCPGKEMVDYICQYLSTVRERQVTPDVQPGYLRAQLPASAPEDPDSWDSIFGDIERIIMPGVRYSNCRVCFRVQQGWAVSQVTLMSQCGGATRPSCACHPSSQLIF